MNKLYFISLMIVVAGCSNWPKVNNLGDDYYLSPFKHGEEISLPPKDHGMSSSSTKKKTPVSQ